MGKRSVEIARPVLVERHSIDGEIQISIQGSVVAVRVRWPFDLMAEDFIVIQETFPYASWVTAVSASTGSGILRVTNAEGAVLTLTKLRDAGVFELQSRPHPSFLARSIELPLSKWPDELGTL